MHFARKSGPPPRWPLPQAVLGIGLTLAALGPLAPGQKTPSEDQVKAAYLLNFAKLAQWPYALPEGPSRLLIGVSGGDEAFLDVVKTVVAGKVVGTHPLLVKAVSSARDMQSCQIVFFRTPGRKNDQAAATVESLTTAGVLLVGEDESFLRQGGMINLVHDHESVRFEVNTDALDRSGIHFSSKILSLAKSGYESLHPAASNSPVEARQLERSLPPAYPEIAGRMNLTGTVQVQALVKPDGTVREVKVLGGHPLLADAVVRAVMQWKYQPAPKETIELVKFSFGPR